MGVINNLVKRFRKEKKVIPRETVLKSKPIRNPTISWELEEGEKIKLTIPLKKSTKLTILSYILRVPPTKAIMLDEIGSEVWILCDGNNSVKDLVASLIERHKLSRREVEVSLFYYLEQLAKRGYIGLQLSKGTELEIGTFSGRRSR